MTTSPQLTAQQIAQYCKAAGFTGTPLIQAVAIVGAESSGHIWDTHLNLNGTYDWGMWQINSSHAGVTKTLAFDPVWSSKWAYGFSKQGTNWSPWAAYGNKNYVSWYSLAIPAVASLSYQTIYLADLYALSKMARSVTPVQDALHARGYLPDRIYVPGTFDAQTQAAYSNWQKHLGYTGADADGIPGRRSLEAFHLFNIVS